MTALRVCIITMLLTLLYLISTVLLTSILFPGKSNGSLIKINHKIIGSKLIGQEFKSNLYFHGRPSFSNYKNDISGNSNFPYYSESLVSFIKDKHKTSLLLNNGNKSDLNFITESASGLDPHITYKGTLAQIDRVANAGKINEETIRTLINKNSKPRIAGLFGEKIVNVLELNVELNKIYAKTPGSRWIIKTNS